MAEGGVEVKELHLKIVWHSAGVNFKHRDPWVVHLVGSDSRRYKQVVKVELS
jgi:hypothetical protein